MDSHDNHFIYILAHLFYCAQLQKGAYRTSWNTFFNWAEVSINTLPAGASVPFVHSHKNNEEIYGVITGKETVIIDGNTVKITAGDWLKISPAAKHQFFAASDSSITYICIQVKENSLDGFTVNDAIIY